MRGHRVRLDDRPDGEVDENFWAQAAADQAAGRADDEGDESKNQTLRPKLSLTRSLSF